MAKGNKNIGKLGKSTQFKKGADSRRNTEGRPRKYLSTLADQGYKNSEIVDTMKVVLSMTASELEKVKDNPTATVLERIVAKAILDAKKHGLLGSLETIITRAVGAPKQTTEIVEPKEEEQIDYSKLSDQALREIAKAKPS